ncbi:MAG: hypothetical protein KC425_17860, partial [Anaerolineales bacterium]|nr:hypothetical protein [Anaerolineales bacterium]
KLTAPHHPALAGIDRLAVVHRGTPEFDVLAVNLADFEAEPQQSCGFSVQNLKMSVVARVSR